jgi:hypothetical protein
MTKVCAKIVPKELAEEHSVKEFLASKQITVRKHPHNSPYLPPMIFCSRNKGNIKRRNLVT